MNLTKRLAVSTVSAALAVAMLPFAASPAAAETQRSTDAAGDTSTEDGPGPGQATADIVAFRSHHGEKRVTVRLDMAAMRDSGKFYATAVIKTNDGTRYAVNYGRTRRGEVEGIDVVRGPLDKGKVVRCEGADGQFLLDEKALRISVPRRCVGNPGWIRTGGFVETRPSQPMAKIYYDDARRDGDASERRIKVGGPRLASG